MLAHEREHIARHDNLKAHLQRLVETLFWFHPLVWFIGRRLLDERERACDEAVLARGHDPGRIRGRHSRRVPTLRGSALAAMRVGALAGDLDAARAPHPHEPARRARLGFTKAFVLTACTVVLAVRAAGRRRAGRNRASARRRRRQCSRPAAMPRAARTLPAPRRECRDLAASGNEVVIRNSSLRELLALAYGVNVSEVTGRGDWLDSPRYDLRRRLPGGVREPEDFDPTARCAPLVNKLLASRFDLEIYVDQECQEPCGPRALAAAMAPASRA